MNDGDKTAILQWQQGEFAVSCDPAVLDVEMVHAYLSQRSYWAVARPREIVEKSIANSLCFGLYHASMQIGFARAVSDFATVFWLADVFVLEEYRGQGLGVWLLECVLAHPALQGVRGILATRDAHGLYAKFGFEPLEKPQNVLRMPVQ